MLATDLSSASYFAEAKVEAEIYFLFFILPTEHLVMDPPNSSCHNLIKYSGWNNMKLCLYFWMFVVYSVMM